MNFKIFLTFILISIFGFSQKNYPNNNVWLTINLKKNYINHTIRFDGGYRTYNFLQNQRTFFGRYTFNTSFNKYITYGGGLSYFNNYSFTRYRYFHEFRPFIETSLKINDHINLRLRDEWRIYQKGFIDENRFRTLISYDQNFKKYVIRGSFAYYWNNYI